MKRSGMVIDLKRCIGCNSCTLACKIQNGTPPGIFFRRVLETISGPAVAHCATGKRSSAMWAICKAGALEVDHILEQCALAGHDLVAARRLARRARGAQRTKVLARDRRGAGTLRSRCWPRRRRRPPPPRRAPPGPRARARARAARRAPPRRAGGPRSSRRACSRSRSRTRRSAPAGLPRGRAPSARSRSSHARRS